MSKNNRQPPSIADAEKKLRQAEFFLSLLEYAPMEIAKRYGSTNPVEHQQLEYYFSACLSAARSVFYILRDSNNRRKFFQIESQWRNNLPSNAVRATYNLMKALRDDDVHYGDAGATPLQKVIEYRSDESALFGLVIHPSGALHGQTPPLNFIQPDGTTVSGRTFRSTLGLYIDHDGGRVEASTACREFIVLLRSLLEATKAAFP